MIEAAFTPKQKAEREQLVLFSTYEIDSIGRHLVENLPTEPEWLFMRSMVLRIIELNSIAMSVTGGDDERKTTDMRRVVEGLT